MLADYIRGGAEAVKKSLISLAQQLIQQFMPGPIGGAIGNLLGALAEKFGQKGETLKTEVINPIAVYPLNLSMMLGNNPAGAVLGNRGINTGAGFMVQVEMKGEAGEMFTAKVVENLGLQNAMEGAY